MVDISWNGATCQWDVSPNNDCDLLDIGTVFTISPDPAAWPANTCVGGSQDFTINYIGLPGGPDCCSTGGPLLPIVYNTTTDINDPVVVSSPYGGTNNAANTTIPGNTIGGDATSFTLTVSGAGYCYPNPAGTSADDSWYVTVWVDGVQILLQGPMNGTTFNITKYYKFFILKTARAFLMRYFVPNPFFSFSDGLYRRTPRGKIRMVIT